MAQETINIGSTPNDGTGDSLRAAGQKINNNFTQLFNVSPISDTFARERANAAFNAANTKLSRTGDVIVGDLIFRTNVVNTYCNTRIGHVQDANGIDVFAQHDYEWAQLNWSNTNIVFVDYEGVVINTQNTEILLREGLKDIVISTNTVNWTFSQNGIVSVFDTATAQRSTLAPGYKDVRLVNVASILASNSDNILLCDPNAVGANIVVNLSPNAGIGKTYTIKNLNPGGFSVNVSGTTRAYPFIEDPTTHALVNRVVMANTGEVYTWVFDSVIYRYIG
jgi:hypothetical protein